MIEQQKMLTISTMTRKKNDTPEKNRSQFTQMARIWQNLTFLTNSTIFSKKIQHIFESIIVQACNKQPKVAHK